MSMLEKVLDVLSPWGITCPLCGEDSGGDVLCAVCAEQLRELRLSALPCPECGEEMENGSFCPHCGSGVRIVSAFGHSGPARHLVHMLKFDASRMAGEQLAQAMTACCPPDLSADAVLTWVPMPKRRQLERGIDHARVLCEYAAAQLGIPCRQLLSRVDEKDTKLQREMDREERLTQKTRFRAGESMPEKVILVDDVITTGATMRECRELLLKAGCKEVALMSATRTVRRGKEEDM